MGQYCRVNIKGQLIQDMNDRSCFEACSHYGTGEQGQEHMFSVLEGDCLCTALPV